MRDIGGFLIIILILFTLLFLTVRFAVPLALTYLGGLIVFFLVAGTLLRKGRRHRNHFDCLLRRRHALLIGLATFAIPANYVGLVYLLGDRDHIPALAVVNSVPPLIWTAWILNLHRRQRRKFYLEGHDVEERLDEALSRADLLDLKIELMAAAADTEERPEPWEFQAGIIKPQDDGLRGRIGRLILEMKQLRDEYQRAASKFDKTLTAIRQAGARPGGHPVRRDDECAELDAAWVRLSQESSLILREKIGYTFNEWDMNT